MDTLLLWDLGVALFILSASFGTGFALGTAVEAARIRHKLISRRL